MRILVTGISGFGGSYVAEELRGAGYDVFGLSQEPNANPQIRIGDLLDTDSLRAVVDDIRPDIVYHLAGQTSVRESFAHPELAKSLNVDGTEHLYRALSKLNYPIRMFLTSSAEVYGPGHEQPITEDETLNPINPYSRSKVKQEAIAKLFPSIQTTVIRPFPYIGPRQRDTFAVASFAHQTVLAETGRQQEITVGNLEAERDFTDVRDFALACRLLMESKAQYPIVNVCSGKSYSLTAVVHLMISMAKRPVTVRVDPTKVRPNDIPVLWGDNRRLRQLTSWKPQYTIEQTIRDTLEYWRQKETA